MDFCWDSEPHISSSILTYKSTFISKQDPLIQVLFSWERFRDVEKKWEVKASKAMDQSQTCI